MSESVQSGSGGLRMDENAAPAPLGAGTILRQAREAAGLHIAVLAVSLKVSVAKLEALEADRLDELPDAVFVRALAASVCRQLKIDPEVVLERLPPSAPRLTPDHKSLNTPFRALEEKSRAGLSSQLSRPTVMAVLAILLGALVLILLPSFSRHAGVGTEPVASLPSLALPAAVSTDKVELPSAPPATALLSPSAPAADTALAAEVPSSAPTVATVAAAPAPADAAADGIIVFTAKAPSWVQVTDAKGNAVLRKILAPAEVARVSAALPLTVVVGRADATSVQVKGKPFDLASSTKNNVARFEVK
ncbi:MAG: helix-turn-helix domain-containing protein [Rhodoferax sp.]